MIRILAILILTCACSWSSAQVNIITTIAGTGTAGYNGDGIPATNAQLNWPCAIDIDYNGDLLIVDPDNVRVRKLTLSTGLITTVAGNGVSGTSGDGGQATLAEFNAPQGICTDKEDNIYVADGLNHRIRKIHISGVITTVVGTGTAGDSGEGFPAISAMIKTPVGISIYGDTLLLLSDYGNHKIKKVSLTTGKLETVAGTGLAGYTGDGGLATSAQLNGPIDVACDLSGNIFISDQWNAVIRKVNIVTGKVSTVVGTGVAGYGGDGGLALNAQLNEPGGIFIDKGNNLFISDYRNGAIRRVDAATSIITTVAGGAVGYGGDGGPATAAKLKCTDVVVDDYGNIYIADYVNDRIRKVSSGVAVNGIDKDVEARLYPNPTNGIFSVQTPLAISLVNVYNIGGVLVHEQTCIGTETQVDITAQPPGAYMVYVQCGEKMYVSKVVRQ